MAAATSATMSPVLDEDPAPPEGDGDGDCSAGPLDEGAGAGPQLPGILCEEEKKRVGLSLRAVHQTTL